MKEISDMNYDTFNERGEQILAENEEALHIFEEDLINSNLAEKTIIRHMTNANLFINDFLYNFEGLSIVDGIASLDTFMGSFFIRKCMWSTPANIKTTAASIKKFYKSMLDHEKITKDDYFFLCSIIKDSMADWQYTCELYNDPDAPNPLTIFA